MLLATLAENDSIESREVCTARGRVDLVAPEQLADHRQRLPERERPGRKRGSDHLADAALQSGLARNRDAFDPATGPPRAR